MIRTLSLFQTILQDYIFKYLSNVSFWKLLIAFIIILFVTKMVSSHLKLSNIAVLVCSVYLTFIVCVTFLGRTIGSIDNSFGTLFSTYYAWIVQGRYWVFYEVLYNIMLFIPMGILAKWHRASVKQAIIEVFVASLIIETGQLVLSIGLFEICDLIDNTIGGILGIVIIMVIDRMRKIDSIEESLSRHNILFLNLLKASLNGSKIIIDSEEDQAYLIQEAIEQAVVGIVFDTLLSACVARNSDYYRLIAYKMKLDYVFKDNLKTQQELIEDLSAAEYHPVIIKGYATAIYYKNPLSRTIGDIDFLVSKGEFTDVVKYLLQHNCLYRDNNYTTPDHHIPLVKNNVVIEPHCEVAGLADIKEKITVQNLIDNSMESPNVIRLEGNEFIALDDISNGLIILLHARSHMNNGIGFRQLIDWMMFVEKHINDEQFNLVWKEIFEKTGLLSFAKIITNFCCEYLYMNGSFSWCEGVNRKYSAQLLEYVFEQGNFGHKIADARMSRAFTKSNSLSDYARQVCESGYGVMKVNEAKFYHVPVAFIIGLLHCFMVFTKCGRIKEYLAKRKKIRRNKRLFQYLSMYE